MKIIPYYRTCAYPSRWIVRWLTEGLGGVAAAVAAGAELGGATTALVRGTLAIAVTGGILHLVLRRVTRDRPAPRVAEAFAGVVTAALALHLWTYHAAPVGTIGLAGDLLYWGSLALGAALGIALAAGVAFGDRPPGGSRERG